MIARKKGGALKKKVEMWRILVGLGVLYSTGLVALVSRSTPPEASNNNARNIVSAVGENKGAFVDKRKAKVDGTVIRKSEGVDWKLWDRRTIIHADSPSRWECNWGVYRPAHAGNATIVEAPICLPPRERDIWVTGHILSSGRWPDCDDLTPNLLKQPKPEGGHRTIHLDIGANIGSCVLQVLLTTPNDVDVYAFEPHPHNLFHLTSTLLALDQTLRDRIYLFPIALGEATGASTMTIDPTNSGNAMVKHGADGAGGGNPYSATVRIERLDDLLDVSSATSPEDPHRISQIKMDAQGFECFILQGMSETLRHSSSLFFEIEPRSLTRFGGDRGTECNAAAMVRRIQEAGLTQLYTGPMDQWKILSDALNEISTVTNSIDLVALRPVKRPGSKVESFAP